MRRRDREIVQQEEITKIIKECKVLHLAMVEEGDSYVIPINFGYEWNDGGDLVLYLHSALQGRKLDMIRRNQRVSYSMCMEGETYFVPQDPCESGCYFASVVGTGEATILEDAGQKCHGLACLMKHQVDAEITFSPQEAKSVAVIQIVSKDYSAKQKMAKPAGHKPESL